MICLPAWLLQCLHCLVFKTPHYMWPDFQTRFCLVALEIRIWARNKDTPKQSAGGYT